MSQTFTFFLVGGFDGHGSSSTVARARELKISLSNVIVKYPDTSPEGTPKLLYSMSLYNAKIELIDIAINVKNPIEWQRLMNIIAQNNEVVIYDHHESNLRLLQYVPNNVKLVQFDNTVKMAQALVQSEDNLSIAYIGSFTDRDPAIASVIPPESREFNEYYTLANVYDVLIRQNLQQSVTGLYSEGLEYLRRMATQVEYPPAKLARQVAVQRRDNIIFADVLGTNLGQWVWKTIDYLLWQSSADYAVIATKVLDRQINAEVPVVFVVKYWLSSAQNPLPIVRSIIGNRKVIGHEEAFSVSATSEQDALQLAEQIVSALESQYSSTATAIGTSTVAKAVQSDFQKILARLTEILDEQRKMYQEYLELKRQQVELLKQSSEEQRRRYD